MKLRKDFVTNSSSSSFIIVAAKVENESRCREWCKYLGLDPDKYITTASKHVWDFKPQKNELHINSFDGFGVVLSNCKSDDLVFVFDKTGNEGDSYFGDDEPDYAIDLDFFDDKTVKVYTEASESNLSGLGSVERTYGAGRNG